MIKIQKQPSKNKQDLSEKEKEYQKLRDYISPLDRKSLKDYAEFSFYGKGFEKNQKRISR